MVATESWWTTSDVAERLSFSRRTLERWRASGVGPPWYKAGRFVRYNPEDVVRWLIEDCEWFPPLAAPDAPRPGE